MPQEKSINKTNVPVWRMGKGGLVWERDHVAIEEPLEIRLNHEQEGLRMVESIAVTMRTPGDDFDLARGFLFTEGIVRQAAHIEQVAFVQAMGPDEVCNRVVVMLQPGVTFESASLTRHVFTSSSCGVCGKVTIDAIHAKITAKPQRGANLNAEVLYGANEKVRQVQSLFRQTGGVHAAALFSLEGDLLDLKEDVGRHNAVDKIIGHALARDRLPLSDTLLWLSGRAGFELIQKAAMAGIPYVAAVGAPSSLSRQLAQDLGICLVGFLKPDRFNVYALPEALQP